MSSSLQKTIVGITAAEFLQELDDLLAKYEARITMSRGHGEHALQIRFKESSTLGMTLVKARPGKGAVSYHGNGFKELGNAKPD